MEMIVALAVPLVIVGFFRWLSLQWFPGVTRPVERVLKGTVRGFWNLTWRHPTRRWGLLNTLWVWMFVVAVITTINSLQNDPSARQALGPAWLVVGSGWLGLRALARWRYGPRGLPTRRPWRERRR